MNTVFLGTPNFAVTILSGLIQDGHTISMVLTREDKVNGRDNKMAPNPVKRFSLSNGLKVYAPKSLNLNGKFPVDAASIHEIIQASNPDIIVVAAYGLILPQSILNIPKYGAINVHASLLPHLRGAAPIQRAIMEGLDTTGITIMKMDSGLDTGNILSVRPVPIKDDDNLETLTDTLANAGSLELNEVLKNMEYYLSNQIMQDSSKSSYANKIEKIESILDIHTPIHTLNNKIRALNPECSTTLFLTNNKINEFSKSDIDTSVNMNKTKVEMIKIIKASIYSQINQEGLKDKTIGEVVFADKVNGLVIKCIDGYLKIEELQKVGGKKLHANDFMNGHKILGHFFS